MEGIRNFFRKKLKLNNLCDMTSYIRVIYNHSKGASAGVTASIFCKIMQQQKKNVKD